VLIFLAEAIILSQASVSTMDSGRCGPSKFSPSVSTESLITLPGFSPLVFRANSYGFNKYRINSRFEGYPVFNIEMSKGGKPDSVTSGDLDTFYTFYRSFLNSDVTSVHQVNNKTFQLELWNLYTLKKDTLAGLSPLRSYPPFVSINILFQVGNVTSLRFNPLISGLTNLIPSGPPQPLPYNYDLYALLPRKSSMAVYEASNFPFLYPKEFLEEKASSKDCPRMKVHVYLKPVSISQKQYDIVVKTQKLLQDESVLLNSQSQYETWKARPDMYITPTQSLILHRRSTSKAAAYMLEFRRNSKGESELDPYSPDCKYLENINMVVKGGMGSGASTFRFSEWILHGLFLITTSSINYIHLSFEVKVT
jgi:hypothetical protein